MNFPILPWIIDGIFLHQYDLRHLADTVFSAITAFGCCYIGIGLLIENSVRTKYDRDAARRGLGLLLTAVIVAVFGVANIVTLVAIVMFAYSFLWRVLFKNITAAFRK